VMEKIGLIRSSDSRVTFDDNAVRWSSGLGDVVVCGLGGGTSLDATAPLGQLLLRGSKRQASMAAAGGRMLERR
jgi:hypothetical protein